MAVLLLAFVFCHCLGICRVSGQVAELTTEDIDAFLLEHNSVRAELQLNPLKWDNELASYAASEGGKCQFEHSNGPYGENLYASSPAKWNHAELAADAVKSWIEEQKFVDYDQWSCITRSDDSCGHYSQIVWRNTEFVGCAIIHCSPEMGQWPNLVFCEYNPRGNFIGELPYK
ncbi:pathogenesis-related protein PR-1 [Biomphalaria glabrata]|nr:pathogenesis-related protein PR-1-like [Biomphalaria glabrata]